MSDTTRLNPHPLTALLIAAGFQDSAAMTQLEFTLANKREPDVLECPEWFWVVIGDTRAEFQDQLRIERCRPYTWTGELDAGEGQGQATLFGWVDEAGNGTSNATASMFPLDDYQVILFKAVSPEEAAAC